MGSKSHGYRSRARIRLIDMIGRSGSTNQNTYSVGTCNCHELMISASANIYRDCVVITTHNGNCYTEICLAFLDDAFVNNCTFILSNKNEIIYHQETSMLRSLSTDTIAHTTNQPDKETTSDTTLLYYYYYCYCCYCYYIVTVIVVTIIFIL